MDFLPHFILGSKEEIDDYDDDNDNDDLEDLEEEEEEEDIKKREITSIIMLSRSLYYNYAVFIATFFNHSMSSVFHWFFLYLI